MKKVLSLALALTMCLGLSIPVLASESQIEINWLPDGMSNLSARYDDMSQTLIPVKQDNKCGFIDINGKTVIPLEYESVSNFSEGLACVEKDGKYGFIDMAGNVVVPFEYDIARDFSDGMAEVRKHDSDWNWSIGFVDTSGKAVVPLTQEYDSVESFSDGMAAVSKNGKTGFIDKTGKLVIPMEYDTGFVYTFSNGIASVFKNGQSFYIDKSGNVAKHSLADYDDYYSDYGNFFFEGLAVVGKGEWFGGEKEAWFEGKYGFADQSGKLVIPFEYDSANNFSEGLACVEKDGKYGYIDKTGKVIIPVIYDEANDFSDGLAVVRIGDWDTGKYGYIDKTGKMIISAQYGNASSFRGGIAVVGVNGQHGCINKAGEIILPIDDLFIENYGPFGIAKSQKDWRTGIFINPYYSNHPTQPQQATPTNDALTCNGVGQTPTVYKINDSNYFKIRDLAAILNGTEKQFSVGYDEKLNSVTAATGEAYVLTGTELKGRPTGPDQAEVSNDTIYVDGKKVEAEVYKINGSNYFKLRDLGKALNFYVGWTQEQGMFIETDKPYSE